MADMDTTRLLDELGYICHDPECEASHVDIDLLPDGPVFTEGVDYEALFVEPTMTVLGKKRL